jgi:hypothetical protein
LQGVVDVSEWKGGLTVLSSAKRPLGLVLVAIAAVLVLGHRTRAVDDGDLPGPLAPPDNLARWGEVPLWEGTFQSDLHMEQKYRNGSGGVRIEDENVVGTVYLDTLTHLGHPATIGSGGSRSSVWHGRAKASVRIHVLDIRLGTRGQVMAREEMTGDEAAEADCDLQIDAPRGAFILHVKQLRIGVRHNHWHSNGSHDPPTIQSYGGTDQVELSDGGPLGGLGPGTLPASGFALTQAATWHPRTSDDLDPRVYSAAYSYTLNPAGQAPPVDLVVTPRVYDTWRPEAGSDERSVGNAITIDAKLQSADGGEPKVKARKIVFQLTGTSREPGIALNFPLAAANPGEFDLQFSPLTNPPGQYSITGSGGQRAETVPGQYTSASAVVSAFDWGAWSTLKVTAELVDGRTIVGHLLTRGGTSEILLPKRARDSKIADSWKQDVGVSLPDLDDSETGPAGDSGKGDGFSLYEEYRGFYVAGQHVAGDPKKMDFFVRNYIGGDAEPGIFLFADLTGAEVHAKLLDSEFDRQGRVMNANRQQGPHVDPQAASSFEQTQGQHGVFLETQAGLDGGLTLFSEAGVRGRPVIAMSANLQPRNSLTGMTTSENVPLSDLAFAYDRAVAHELLHTVGAEEHGKGDGTATFYFHFGDDPQNGLGKSYFSFSRQLAGENIFGMTPLPGVLDPKTIIDEATGRDLASMMEGDMMLRREALRPIWYPDKLTEARKFLAARQGYKIPWTAEQLAEHDLDTIASDQFALSLYIGAEHGECSGDELCVMRYYFAKLYEKRGTRNAFYYISDTRTERAGRGLCRSPAGTGINDRDRDKPQPQPQPRYGDAAATRGACAASIIFNDALPLIPDAIPTEPRK